MGTQPRRPPAPAEGRVGSWGSHVHPLPARAEHKFPSVHVEVTKMHCISDHEAGLHTYVTADSIHCPLSEHNSYSRHQKQEETCEYTELHEIKQHILKSTEVE
jgi:hypothetical protein